MRMLKESKANILTYLLQVNIQKIYNEEKERITKISYSGVSIMPSGGFNHQ